MTNSSTQSSSPSITTASSSLAVNLQNLHLAPLRSLDDFILGSARFQIPNFRDLDKWENRIIKNLLYYQTNYILMFSIIYLLMLIIYPGKIICGLLVKTILIAVVIFYFTNNNHRSGSGWMAGNFRSPAAAASASMPYQKWLYLGITTFSGYLLLTWFDALLLSTFTLLLPFCATFVHSSLRLRNIRNKVVNTMESLGPSTPMGVFLNSMNIAVDRMLN